MTNREERARKAAESFTDYINTTSPNECKEFATAITRQHRTLQQGSFRAMVACIKEWSDMYESGWYDLRNEDTVKACHDLWHNHLKDVGIRFI